MSKFSLWNLELKRLVLAINRKQKAKRNKNTRSIKMVWFTKCDVHSTSWFLRILCKDLLGTRNRKPILVAYMKGGLRHRTDKTSVIPSFLLSLHLYVPLLVYSILLSADQHHPLPGSWFLLLHNFTLHQLVLLLVQDHWENLNHDDTGMLPLPLPHPHPDACRTSEPTTATTAFLPKSSHTSSKRERWHLEQTQKGRVTFPRTHS